MIKEPPCRSLSLSIYIFREQTRTTEMTSFNEGSDFPSCGGGGHYAYFHSSPVFHNTLYPSAAAINQRTRTRNLVLRAHSFRGPAGRLPPTLTTPTASSATAFSLTGPPVRSDGAHRSPVGPTLTDYFASPDRRRGLSRLTASRTTLFPGILFHDIVTPSERGNRQSRLPV